MTTPVFTQEQIIKIRQVIDLGVANKEEIKLLNEGLRETITEIAKELDVPKKMLNSAIKVAFKAKQTGSTDKVIEEQQNELDETQELLKKVGRNQ